MKLPIILLILFFASILQMNAQKIVVEAKSSENKALIKLDNAPKLMFGGEELTFTDGEKSASFSRDLPVVMRIREVGNPVNMNANEDPQHRGDFYATFYDSECAYEVPAGVIAYTASVGDEMIFTPIEDGIIRMGEAVLLKSNGNAYTLTYSDNEDEPRENDLDGVDEATPQADGNSYYVLSGSSAKGVGFFRLKDGINLGAHKAFYCVEGGVLSREMFGFGFEDDPTRVDGLEIENVVDKIYSIDGLPLLTPRKGINIINGKKVIVR